ncbi:hypothetical protein EU508_00105 [Pseudoalteromonas fuliginea]|uniref:Topoisomerase II n=1 Tax=Pseudoalteromonas fuliginea TaxID=1872678 RepID=A0AB73BM17_9GAMM|nr:hypothetical protein [Pseudoalteromonas fuliginea]KAA1166398.1 hypothetical protein EU508_00105 [Pseudoalteromonas fuliginea]
MAKRDPEVTRRNKEIDALSKQIKEILPEVLRLTAYKNEHSLNATYGGKYAEYIDIKNEVIDTPQQFRTLYLKGFLATLEDIGRWAKTGNKYYDAFVHYRDQDLVKEWLHLFLERTYLRKFDELSKVRPTVEEAIMWIGQENASYGILVAPRFRNGQWENDKSEIRRFKKTYWTIGHILETGLVVPHEDEQIEFANIEQYLTFFKNTLVRNSGSKHELEVAKRYCEFVRSSEDPEKVPLLIPEFRYGGIEKKHEYRLDFTIINPYNMNKVGFELSPWSTHGALKGTKDKLQKDINAEALANFEKEMKKLKSYFRKFSISILVYTDSDLADPDELFNSMKEYLNVESNPKQLEFHAMEELLNFQGA